MIVLEYRQVDVFAEGPLSGNGLAVILTDEPLNTAFMQRLTGELRQFETIFLTPRRGTGDFDARVFTMEEELPFAGHPVLGAAAVLHERAAGEAFDCTLVLPAGPVPIRSRRTDGDFQVKMNQGQPLFGAEIAVSEEAAWLEFFGLRPDCRDIRMPICVASTGLPYLVVPVTGLGLAEARIVAPDLERRLASVGAKFAYVLDVEGREGRTWDNRGQVEDVATGSAAGPAAALLVRHGLAKAAETITIRQGRFVGRPSEMRVEVPADQSGIVLTGKVCMVASGRFDAAVVG